jgi:VanZ family protein
VLIAWIPTLVWLGVIATESTSTFSGGRTMVWIHRVLSYFYPHITWTQVYYVNVVLRKTGHFLGYATLSWFAFRAWMETLAYQRERWLRKLGKVGPSHRRWHLRAAVLAVLVTVAAAGLDEFHQLMLSGRTGSLHDVILDSMGGVFAQIFLLLYWTWKNNGRHSRQLSDTDSVDREHDDGIAVDQ